MTHVTRIYNGNLHDKDLAPSIVVLNKQDLWDENIGFEEFAELVWSECERSGFYDDGDPGDCLCMYLRGAVV